MRSALPCCLLLALTACADPPAPTPVRDAATPSTPPAAAEAKADPPATPSAKPAASRPPPEDQHTFEAQLALADRQVSSQLKTAKLNGRSSMAYGRVASAYLMRARLSGDWDDYAKAESFVDQAFELGAKTGYGPFMVRAQLNYTLHRLDRVDADFEQAITLPSRTPSEMFQRELFGAKVAFQRGQYDLAKRGLDSARRLQTTVSTLAALALYHWKAAQFDEAERLYAEALEIYRGTPTEPKAWVHLQLGLMDLDRGRWDEALAHYREGEALIRGYWLLDEHIAEILTLQGQTAQAQAMYRAIIERTGNPEFMDAMAGIARAAGNEAEASTWVSQARTAYEKKLAQFPEAAYGHALEHFLEFGDDPARTVTLAEKNHTLRPNVDAKRLLAEAYLGAERAKDARTIIEQALKTPMRSADLHATAAAVYAALGKDAKVTEHQDAARAINPKIELP